MADPKILQQLVSNTNFRLAASLGLVAGVEPAVGFGHCPDVAGDVVTDVWERGATQPVYLFPDDVGEAVTLVSTDVGDAQPIVVQGLDQNGDPRAEQVTLNGTTPVALSGLWRAFNAVYNDGATALAGQVTIQGDGSTSTNVFAFLDTDDQQASQALFMVPRGKLAVIVNFSTAANKTGGAALSSIFSLGAASSGKSGVFRNQIRYGLQRDGTSNISSDLVIPVLVPELSFVKVSATPSSGPTDVSAEFSIFLVDENLIPAAFLNTLKTGLFS